MSTVPFDMPIPTQEAVEQFAARQWAYGQMRNPEEERVDWSSLDEVTKYHVKEAVFPTLVAATAVLTPVLLDWAADMLTETDPLDTALAGIDYPINVLRDLAGEARKALDE